MEKIAWGKEFVTGVELIDFQHLLLIEQINELISIYNNEIPSDNFLDTLSFLVYYCNSHFITEEAMFKNSNYKEAEKHILEHEKFKRMTKNIIEGYQKKFRLVEKDDLLFFKNWLQNHILIVDKAMVKELKDPMSIKNESK